MQHVKNAIGGNAMKMLKMHQNALNAQECVWEKSTPLSGKNNTYPIACAKCGRVAGNAGALSNHVEQCGKTGPTRAERQAQAAKKRRAAKKRAAGGDAAVEPDGDAPQDE